MKANDPRWAPGICVGCGEPGLIYKYGMGYCSKSCANMRHDTLGYSANHKRVNASRGPATSCVWGCASDRYEWANLTGDYEDPMDYAQMCNTCNQRYDQARRTMDDGYVPINSKLTEEIVLLARKRHYEGGESQAALAREYGVDKSTMHLAIIGKNWGWL